MAVKGLNCPDQTTVTVHTLSCQPALCGVCFINVTVLITAIIKKKKKKIN